MPKNRQAWPTRLPVYEHSAADNRFALGTLGDAPLVCFGVNPSIATDTCSDRTLRKVEEFATAQAFDSWLMFNLYAQRATYPRDMHAVMDSALHDENMTVIGGLVAGRSLTSYAGWGVLIMNRPYLVGVLRDIVALPALANVTWMCRGQTKDRHPRHPSRLPDAQMIEPFDVHDYLAGL